LIVQANTAYSKKGHIIIIRSEIIKNYLKTWFPLDFLSGIPFELIFPSISLKHPEDSVFSSNRLYRLFWLLKLLKILKFQRIVYKFQYLFAYTLVHSITNFFITSFIVSFCIHTAAFISNLLYIEGNETGFNLENNWTSNRTKHLHFLHRAVQTVTSVGFGDTKLASTNERLVATIMMICTSGLMGYFVGSLETIISVYNEKQNFYHDVMMRFKKYSNAKKLPSKLRRKVLNYYRHLIQMSKVKVLGEEQLLSVLSAPLRVHVNLVVRGYVLMKVSNFVSYSAACKKALGERMTIEMYSPFDMIIKEEELSTNLFFIILGKVEIFHGLTRTVFIELTEGNSFGEIAFFTKSPRRASARSIGFSELFTLSRFDYEQVTQNLPKDKEKGEVIFRNFSKYGLAALGVKCYFCRVNGHVAPECPSGSFKVSIQKIMRMYQNKRNRACRKSFVVPRKQVYEENKKILDYRLRNAKGYEMEYGDVEKNRIEKMIKMNYLQIYKKKKKLKIEVYDSESDDEPKVIVKPPVINIGNSRKERSSTVLVSNNFTVN
jgi:hypothetical protein